MRLLATVGCCLSAGLALADPPATSDELLAAVRNGRAILTEADARGTTYRCRSKLDSTLDSKSNLVRDVLIKRVGDNLLCETADAVCGLNDEYAFGIQRSKTGGEWYIILFGREDRGKVFQKVTASMVKMFAPLTTFGNDTTRDDFLFATPTAALRNVRRTREDLVTADYSAQGTATLGGPGRSLSGAVTFSPTRHHLITEFSTTFQNATSPSFRYAIKRELIEGRDPPRVKTLVITSTDPATGRMMQTEELTFSDYKDSPPAAEEFTLGHYGLPVPADEKAPRRWPLWTGLGVCAIIAVAWTGWRTVRRRPVAGN